MYDRFIHPVRGALLEAHSCRSVFIVWAEPEHNLQLSAEKDSADEFRLTHSQILQLLLPPKKQPFTLT